jgi:hypothetical protein
MAGIYEMLVTKPEEKILLEVRVPRNKWEDNIEMNCKEIG